jgi:hypothetical protein
MTEEDEEFNRIEREAKQRMEAVSAALNKKAENARELGLDYEPAQQEYERGFIDGMQEQMKRSVDRAVNAMAQRTWVGLIRGVRVEGDTVVITVKGGNDVARELCGALLEEKNT